MYQSISSSSRKKRSWFGGRTHDYGGEMLFVNLIRQLVQHKKCPEYLQDNPNIAKVKTCDFQTSRDESELCLNRDNDS